MRVSRQAALSPNMGFGLVTTFPKILTPPPHPRSLAQRVPSASLVPPSVRPFALSLLRSSNSNFCPILTSGDGRPDHCTRWELIMYPMTRLYFRAGLHVQDFDGYLKSESTLGFNERTVAVVAPAVCHGGRGGFGVIWCWRDRRTESGQPIPPRGNYCFRAKLLCPFNSNPEFGISAGNRRYSQI